MSAAALALVLAAALLHALWNLGAKKAQGNHHFVLASSLGVALLWLPVAVYVGVDELPRWGWPQWAATLLSAALHLAYFNALLAGYRASDMTVVYPVARGSGPLISSLVALVLLDEHLGVYGALGLAGVVGGILLIAAGPALLARGDAEQQRRRKLGLLWGLLTGATIASYSVVDGYAVKMLAVSPLLYDYLCNLLRVPLALPPVLRDRGGFWPALRRQWPYALLVAALSPLAYILVLYAMQLAPLSRVAPARELSMLVAALLGGQLLGEGERGWRLAGAVLIAAGVVGLAAS
ncbi:DMT family transporter [Pelomonas sp. CA6]|uniref:DMT family transporter n=1 Tax=Pelomonas sp. CA6 TaxID=2907999 RepID=UPI001F4B17E5|nr:DMT family transporter [Pelomonas sp. CA6]MCH7342171.1 DMT family transporter [Pelomonas sp. CA6]